jgi:hypothetical protein
VAAGWKGNGVLPASSRFRGTNVARASAWGRVTSLYRRTPCCQGPPPSSNEARAPAINGAAVNKVRPRVQVQVSSRLVLEGTLIAIRSPPTTAQPARGRLLG